MRTGLNLVGYQLVWFAAVLGAARGHAEWGLLAGLMFIVAHLMTSAVRRADAALAVSAVALGFVLDGCLSWLGLVEYRAATSPWPPLWLLAIWASFGLTLNHSFALSQRHLGLTAAVGAIGGPLAYLAAERLGAVQLALPAWHGVLALALAWGLVLPLLAGLARGRRFLVRHRADAVVA
ncbi:MAG: hypothetical protein AMXMBFR59_18650 [Rhodanobacteraceae bacterium]